MALQGWTQDRVLGMAPDPASAQAGQGLAHGKKWVSLGQDGRIVWGECQGSGSKPYQVRFDSEDGGNKCSCPSRKFPCKHVIGLMLVTASSPGLVKEGARPAWVEEWAASRAERAEKARAKAEAPAKPVDKEAQAKRRQARLGRIADGLAATRVWAEDLLRQGLANVPGKGYEFFDEPARRMVDAQAPGVARRIKRLGEIAASGAHWQRAFLEELASVHLLARAVERFDKLPSATRQDVLATLGMPPDEGEAPPAVVNDSWQVVAQERTVEDRLRAQRTWLFGRKTKQAAVVLEFAYGTQPFATVMAPATEFDGEVKYFPGTPLRATIGAWANVRGLKDVAGVETLGAMCAAVGEVLAQQPWTEEVVVPLKGVVPIKAADGWAVVDPEGKSLSAVMTEASGWLALAVSGGRPVDLVVGYDGRRLRAMGIVDGMDYVPLTVGEGAGVAA